MADTISNADWLRMTIDNDEHLLTHFQYVERELAQWDSQVDADRQMQDEVDAFIFGEIGDLPADTITATVINGFVGDINWKEFRDGLIEEDEEAA